MARITYLRIRNYRSIRDVELSDLGPLGVFYGPSGAGKSNLVQAINTFLRIGQTSIARGNSPRADNLGLGEDILRFVEPEDAWAFGASRVMGLQLRFRIGPDERHLPSLRLLRLDEIRLSISVDFFHERSAYVRFDELSAGGVDLRDILDAGHGSVLPASVAPILSTEPASLRAVDVAFELRSWLLALLSHAAFWLVPDVRYITRRPEVDLDEREHFDSDRQRLLTLMRRRRHAQAMSLASGSAEDSLFAASRRLHQVLVDPPLSRPPARAVYNSARGVFEVREELPGSRGRRVRLDAAGFGIGQLYAVLGETLLSGAGTVAVEEPEAHLHGPTTGLQLRQALRNLVDRGDIEQLFLVTHSDQFDIDPTGYFDVRLRENDDGSRETVVERKTDLLELYRDRIWSPGAAFVAMTRFLADLPDDHVVTWQKGRDPVTAAELRCSLEEDPQGVAQQYIEHINEASVAYLRVRKDAPP